MRNDWDDDRLLAALGRALKAREAVPSWFIETGKSAFAWHNIEAELAQLTYDSHQDRRPVAVLRSETASIRALTFTSAHLSLELEVTGNSLLGQLLPPRAGEAGDSDQGGRNQHDRGGRDRLLLGRPHSGKPVPVALPGRRRHRRADRVGHDLTGSRSAGPASGGGKPGPGVTNRRCTTNFVAMCIKPKLTALRTSSRVREGRGDPRARREAVHAARVRCGSVHM